MDVLEAQKAKLLKRVRENPEYKKSLIEYSKEINSTQDGNKVLSWHHLAASNFENTHLVNHIVSGFAKIQDDLDSQQHQIAQLKNINAEYEKRFGSVDKNFKVPTIQPLVRIKESDLEKTNRLFESYF